MEDAAKRMAKAGKGAGMGVGLMSALGAAAVGLYQSVYTGKPTTLTNFSLAPSIYSVSLSLNLL